MLDQATKNAENGGFHIIINFIIIILIFLFLFIIKCIFIYREVHIALAVSRVSKTAKIREKGIFFLTI